MLSLDLYFGILLLATAIAITCLAVHTCMQVFRLRNKRISWRSGTLKGFPLFSSIFLSISILLAGAMWIHGTLWEFAAAGLYLCISSAWFVSSYFSSKRYITDNGIVKNVNDPAQTVAWHQIHDFFEQPKDGGHEYIFIYRERTEGPLQNVIRLPLDVPKKKHEAFKRLISHKLGRRISCYEKKTIDVTNFE